VAFSLPKGVTINGITAEAADKTDAKGVKLTQAGKPTDTSIDLGGCVDKHGYAVSVILVDAKGSHTGSATGTVTCTVATQPPAGGGTPKPPSPPTNVKAQAVAGEKITVSFTASTDSAVTSYTATAMNAKGGGNFVKESTPDSKAAPITLSGCADGTSYVVTVVANIQSTPSEPAKAPSVKCTK